MFLQSASHAQYDFIQQEVKFLKNKCECVIDNFLGLYEPLIKKLNRNTLLNDIHTFYNPNSALDNDICNNNWKSTDGVSAVSYTHLTLPTKRIV